MAEPKSRAKRGVDKSAILEAAFALYSAEGEAGFSLRKLGAAAGVDPMTVLHHFRSKSDLLRAIADYAVTALDIPTETDDWRADLLAVGDAYRVLAHRHPHVFMLHFKFHATGPADHVASEVVYSAMRRAGFADAEAAGLGLAFYAFVLGFGLSETEGLLRPITDADEAELLQLDADGYPATRALIPAFKALQPDTAFANAMNALIAGLALRAGKAKVAAR